MTTPFIVGNPYTSKEIYNLIRVPKKPQRHIWGIGGYKYNKDLFIFVDLNRDNLTSGENVTSLKGNNLDWYGTNQSRLKSWETQSILNPSGNIYIFTRENKQDLSYIYQGKANVKQYFDSTPIRVIWELIDFCKPPETVPEEVNDKFYYEGATITITVNAYERNPVARRKCLDYYGYNCYVCNFNFGEKYGDIGESFIHVHHLLELNQIGEEYVVDPIKDLRPVCPNCHAMLHKRTPAYSIEELKRKTNN